MALNEFLYLSNNNKCILNYKHLLLEKLHLLSKFYWSLYVYHMDKDKTEISYLDIARF